MAGFLIVKVHKMPQDAMGIYFLFLYLCHIYLIRENTSLNSRGKNKRYLFIFMYM